MWIYFVLILIILIWITLLDNNLCVCVCVCVCRARLCQDWTRVGDGEVVGVESAGIRTDAGVAAGPGDDHHLWALPSPGAGSTR